MMTVLKLFGRGLRNGFVAIGALAFLGTVVAVADYAVTQGSGTTFASIIISTKHYAEQLICDATVGETRCATVGANGSLHTLDDNSAAALAALQGSIPAGTATIGGTIPSPSAASANALAPVVTAAVATSEVIKASAGNLYSFDVSVDTTLSPSPWWILILNATSDPGNGSVTPLKCYAMPSNTTNFSAAFPMPVAFSTGIVIVASTTGCFTETTSAHAFISGDAR